MVTFSFITAAIIYSISASLPFLKLSAKVQYSISVLLSIIAGLTWTTISRNIHKDKVIIYGAYFDIMLTLIFLAVPLFINGFTLSTKETVGVIFLIIGLLFLKGII